ncbi:MAG: MerR family transcriptional regulator [Oscillospiraceae bacterium]|nr:MerR family transcriptional regulator [Oscillospiraceae bacterium]
MDSFDRSGLLSIGVIAKSFGVSENNIRRMEAAGLLEPVYVSEKSGYRYYNGENISRIAAVLALKSFGFVYEDIREHLKHPGDFAQLYGKLLEKQNAINLLVEKVGRLMKNADEPKFDIQEYPETCCLIKKVRAVPKLGEISNQLNRFLFEAIKEKNPIDYTMPVLIVTDCMDYRNYSWRDEQELTFGIPLREKKDDENVLLIPSSKVASFKLSYPFSSAAYMLTAFDELLRIHNVRQSGAMRATFDLGPLQNRYIKEKDVVMHVLVPVE